MSRKGKAPITLPKEVEVRIAAKVVTVKGPKGSLTQELMPGIIVTQENGELLVQIQGATQGASQGATQEAIKGLARFHGLYRVLIYNMVVGITTGFERKLEMIGVGYRAAVQGELLDLQVGNSHPTKLQIPQGIQVTVEKNTKITVAGINKQQVGQFAALIRAKKPPEPYQGKGIRYKGEYVRKKAGKAGKTK